MKLNFLFASAALVTALSVSALAEDAAGVVTVKDDKSIDLAAAFPDVAAAQGRVFNARILELAPGARTERIDHAGRPSITYVTLGSVLEHRDEGEPIRRALGDATLDRSDIKHFWENDGDAPARLLVVEVAPVAGS